jgi:hypothetical protein
MIKKHIQEAIQGYQLPQETCSCGCGGCDVAPKIALLETKAPISEGLRYHIENGVSLQDNVFRIGSKKYLQLFAEARMLNEWKTISLDENSLHLIENTDIGKFGIYEGKKVPLDLPMLDEQGEDTSWTDDEGNKITLQDILDMTKNVPQKDYPTEKLAKIVLNWDDNPEEVERIDQVEISKQYPILIMVDEGGKIQWILDGNHRAQKALRSKSKTIPAKLIKPSNLDAKAKKILLGLPIELNEGKKVPLDLPKNIEEAEFKGKEVEIGKPKRGGSKAYYVYVMDGDKVKKVSFGSGGLRAKIKNKEARNAFAARHNCDQKKDRTTAGYWSCNLPRYAPALGLGPKMNTYW